MGESSSEQSQQTAQAVLQLACVDPLQNWSHTLPFVSKGCRYLFESFDQTDVLPVLIMLC